MNHLSNYLWENDNEIKWIGIGLEIKETSPDQHNKKVPHMN